MERLPEGRTGFSEEKAAVSEGRIPSCDLMALWLDGMAGLSEDDAGVSDGSRWRPDLRTRRSEAWVRQYCARDCKSAFMAWWW